jgi:hypothetical protein
MSKRANIGQITRDYPDRDEEPVQQLEIADATILAKRKYVHFQLIFFLI